MKILVSKHNSSAKYSGCAEKQYVHSYPDMRWINKKEKEKEKGAIATKSTLEKGYVLSECFKKTKANICYMCFCLLCGNNVCFALFI